MIFICQCIYFLYIEAPSVHHAHDVYRWGFSFLNHTLIYQRKEVFDDMNNVSLPIISSFLYVITYMLEMAVVVLTIVAKWKVFRKAGEPGWAAIIPFYNTYTQYKIAGKKKLFIPVLAISIGTVIISFFGTILLIIKAFTLAPDSEGVINNSSAGGFIALILLFVFLIMSCAIAITIIEIIVDLNFAKAFGQHPAFGIGLALLPAVFWMILAFSNMQYVGTEDHSSTQPITPTEVPPNETTF